MYAMEAVGLTKYYGKARGIAGVDLSVEEGEFFGFIGPNGAGKSTTIRTFLGLIKSTGGSARIFDQDIRTQRKDILSQVGYLPSETTFYSGMKVKDVIRLSADLRKKKCRKEARKLCERLELDTEKRVEELSFGNRKKVGIVCALQHKPRLCILDEPTSGLDPLMQREFFSILKERNEKGATIFLSSHILSEVQHYCNRAAIIREGQIVACDDMETLARTSVKRVRLEGFCDLEGLPGIRDMHVENNSVMFLYSGEIEPLLKRLVQAPVRDLTITEPDLEEVFMHYYEKGGDQA